MTKQFFYRIAGPVIGMGVAVMIDIPGKPQAGPMLGIALWMAIWWISECVPLVLTALLPLTLFPILGIAPGKSVAPKYVNAIIFLFLGGFMIARAMELTGLHRRIALNMLGRLHASPLQLAFGFSLITAFLSMWISNTATTMLMATIALPLLNRLMEEHGVDTIRPMATGFLLIIAYSANLGGMGTPVGTAPNLVFLENIRQTAPALTPSFLQWMVVGIPAIICGLCVLFLFLGPAIRRLPWKSSDHDAIQQDIQTLGPVRREERVVASLLFLTAILWMTRKGIQTETFTIPGWSSLLPHRGVDDGTVAILMAGLLFLFRRQDGKAILSVNDLRSLPWDIVLLLGGGFALAYGMQNSGLSGWLGDQMGFLGSVPTPLMMLGVALTITFLTEITSNTATTQVMLPILAAVTVSQGIDPLLILIPATLSASCAFMLPVATPPNAIVFGSGMIPINRMVKTGIWMNLTMTLVIVATVYLLRPMLPNVS